MLSKWGKFYARWTDTQGKRHVKACRSKKAAVRFQREQTKLRTSKKARASRTARPSSTPGPRKRRGPSRKQRPARSARKSAISHPRN